ncbi:MAG: RagB/SusD family nutrient uptake outer membrane protein [Tannerellaceae bacterium]|jgi:hypothetical protein|nr:RagB/SusD family nutrient uptake outer membrane protein [Tannerellaceae bacterium]
MKNINKHLRYAVMGLLAGICFTACDLNELPEATASKVAIFESRNGMELYSNSFYDILPTPYDGVFAVDNVSDIIARNGVDLRLTPNALSAINSSGWSWTNLRNINYFIDGCESSSVAEKNHYIGLARFFRAYFYFDKVKRFGDVPWIDRTIDVNDEAMLYGPRTDRFEVMEHVLEDLNFAISNITKTSDASSTTITVDVAKAFKTRVCLFEAAFRKYHTSYGKETTANTWYQEVVNTANSMSAFSLVQSENAYREIFLLKQPDANETILAVALDAALQTYSSRNRKVISPTYGDRPALTRRFVNTYLNADGTRFTDNPNYTTTPFAEEVKGRDPRLAKTIRAGNYHRTENGVPVIAPPNLDQSYTGYQIIKGCYDERFPYDDESRNENAHLIFRWAEVLLNKAEAMAELGIMTNTDWAATIGALRARAGITGSSLNTLPVEADPYMLEFYNNKFTNPVLLEIFRERAIEMVTEGLRPDDLYRWKMGELFQTAPMNGMYVPALGEYDLNEDGTMDVCFYMGERPSSSNSSITFVEINSSGQTGTRSLSEGTSGELIWNPGAREWLDKKYLYPVPEADRVKNPALEQNPGWE